MYQEEQEPRGPEAETDSESVYSEYASDASETTNATSSILSYQYENGRRYHAYRAGQYLLPNDEAEQERLDIIHHIFTLALKEAGTGTGLWWLIGFGRLSAPLKFDIAPEIPGMLREAGFEHVEFTQKVVPMGTWPNDPKRKEIGRLFRVQFVEMALEVYSLALFSRAGGWSNEEAQALFTNVREELKSNQIHLYTCCSFATGKQPKE
ncbi:hypothetical protein N0V84_009111 [Fusarium piperis]|uniref:Methyltransferase n=1 Tax=Fusarium piperis TaxID=1435070 RepID=A0A9W8W6W7_9HYPO|nr:hypothetical protein N0V84_009111 [Fusarium piperis]